MFPFVLDIEVKQPSDFVFINFYSYNVDAGYSQKNEIYSLLAMNKSSYLSVCSVASLLLW